MASAGVRAPKTARETTTRGYQCGNRGVNRITTLGNPGGVQADVRQQRRHSSSPESGFVIGPGVDDVNVRFILWQPIFIVRQQHVVIGGTFLVDRHVCTWSVQGVHRHRFHGIDIATSSKGTPAPSAIPCSSSTYWGYFSSAKGCTCAIESAPFPGQLKLFTGISTTCEHFRRYARFAVESPHRSGAQSGDESHTRARPAAPYCSPSFPYLSQ